MATWLDIDRLYLLSDAAARGLQLLPLVFIGASPPSAKNACYFFNRLEKDGVRFVDWFGFGTLSLGIGAMQVLLDRGRAAARHDPSRVP